MSRAYWFLKPGENSNRGNGISVEKSFNCIKDRVAQLHNERTLIIQKYITNLFLYDRRKFDIRVYMMGVNIGGALKFYWLDEGYIRTCCYRYNLEDYGNLYIHLTNDAVQQSSEKYGKYE